MKRFIIIAVCVWVIFLVGYGLVLGQQEIRSPSPEENQDTLTQTEDTLPRQILPDTTSTTDTLADSLTFTRTEVKKGLNKALDIIITTSLFVISWILLQKGL